MDVQRPDRPLHLPSDARGGRTDHGLLRGTYLVLGGVLPGTRSSNQRLREYRRGRFSQGTEVSQRIRVSDERQAGGVRRYGPAGVLAAQLLGSGRGHTRLEAHGYRHQLFRTSVPAALFDRRRRGSLFLLEVAPAGERSRLPERKIDRFRHQSEEHTSELQSPCNLVCRLLLEKKKNTNIYASVLSRSCTN